MNRSRVLVLIGGITLIFSTLLPWATVTSTVLGFSRSVTGIEGDGILLALAGVLFVIVSLAHKGKPGAVYSPLLIILTLLCGLLVALKMGNVLTLQASQDVIPSAGIGLTFVAPLALLLLFIGSLLRVPGLPATPAPGK